MSELNRRQFLKLGGTTTVGLAAASGLPPSLENFSETKQNFSAPPSLGLKPLANLIEELKSTEIWDYVIVGSGYGGSVLGARLSEKYSDDKSICILERGQEWMPGTFPQKLDVGLKHVRSPLNPLGLYDFHFHNEVDVFVGSGLGGTSLLNANVAITPDKELFEKPQWPEEIKSDYFGGQMENYFNRVRQVLQVEKYPESQPLLPKAQVLKDAADTRGANFERTSLTVNFTREDGELNYSGTPQNKCRLCGDCVSGCNYGAKNTLNLNYLPLAKRPLNGKKGVKIFTQIEVDYIEKDENSTGGSASGDGGAGGYKIWYLLHKKGTSSARSFILARNVIVSAGTLGSTKILLRSKVQGQLPLSENVGRRFSANGDYLAMSYNGDVQTNVLGFGTSTGPESQFKAGVTMEVAADYRNKAVLEDRFLIENGAIPNMLVDIMRRTSEIGKFQMNGVKFFRAVTDLFKRSTQGALNHSMLYLATGHDDSNGVFNLDDKKENLVLKWPGLRNQRVFKLISDEIKAHAKLNGGVFTIPNPRWAVQRHLMTVHPLGGCSMGADSDTGVIDHRGRVFDASSTDKKTVLEGLFVADGSIMPMALGVNPLLTISALSERIADFLTGARTD